MTIQEEIQNYANLPEGWHFGEGKAVSQNVIDRALSMTASLTTVGYRVSAAPGTNDYICLALDFGNWLIELDVNDEEAFDLMLHDKTHPSDEIALDNLSYQGALAILTVFFREKNKNV